MSLDVCIPVARIGNIETVLDSFEWTGRTDFRVVLASNEIKTLKPRPFEVYAVRFSSETRYYGLRAIPLGYNMAVQGSDADRVLIWDDDQLAPRSLFDDLSKIDGPFGWGNYRYFPEGLSAEDVVAQPASAGRSRENPPNHNHLYFSGYTGLLLIDRAAYWETGGLDMLLEHSTDQQFARRLAERYGDGQHTFVYDPPFAWHPDFRIPYTTDFRTNGCGDHRLAPSRVNNWKVRQCERCPWFEIDADAHRELVTLSKEPGLRFDPSEWTIRLERLA